MHIARNNILIGGLLVVLGVIFLAENYHFMPQFLNLSRLWPLFLILGGLFVLFNKDDWHDRRRGGE
jgi:hypothetical protein